MRKLFLFFFMATFFILSALNLRAEEAPVTPGDSVVNVETNKQDLTNVTGGIPVVDVIEDAAPLTLSENQKTTESTATVSSPASQTSSNLEPSLSVIAQKTTAMQMKSNWEELFTSKKAAGISSYTVQSGDSLYVIARKKHLTSDLIKKLNSMEKDTVYAGRDLTIYTGNFSMAVDKSANVLTLFAGDKAIKEYRVSTGKNNGTPTGEFKIKDKLVNPTWFKTGAIYAPGSKDNQLGTRWLGFDKPGYGIHGTIEPEKIGRQVSEGCIRMRNEEVEELYSIVPVGARVIVQD